MDQYIDVERNGKPHKDSVRDSQPECDIDMDANHHRHGNTDFDLDDDRKSVAVSHGDPFIYRDTLPSATSGYCGHII